MKNTLEIRFTANHYKQVYQHLYPGDQDEHGVVLLAGMAKIGTVIRLMVREVHFAKDGHDYVHKNGHYALKSHFIRPLIAKAREKRLVYLAVHNHMSSTTVDFSHVDFLSHEEGYPALLDLAKGMPVGALVFGTSAIQADLWLPEGGRISLKEAFVVGRKIQRLYPRPPNQRKISSEDFNRQILMFGEIGQSRLKEMTVAVLGLGGIGSLVSEYLARLGVGNFVLVDTDTVDHSNLSRLVGATIDDANSENYKVDIAERHIREMNKFATIEKLMADVADPDVVERLKSVDYIFLAADTMRARLVVNGLTQQFFVPAVQLGAKVVAEEQEKNLAEAMSVVRPMRPGCGCLVCSGFVNSHKLTLEFLSEDERKAADYGTKQHNPSVITLNAVSASIAVNDFLFDTLGLREDGNLYYSHISHINSRNPQVSPRNDDKCTECGALSEGSRFAMGDATSILAFEQFRASRREVVANQPKRLGIIVWMYERFNDIKRLLTS